MRKEISEHRGRWRSLKEFYQLYTSGLSRVEIERLLKQESLGIYSYYNASSSVAPAAGSEDGAMVKSAGRSRALKRLLLVVKRIFLSFVMKLTPARRMFYGVAVLLFVFAALVSNWLYGLAAFLLVNALLAFELADKMLAKDELEIARDIQLSLQPDLPALSGAQLAAFYRPAKEVGGDYYDVIQLDERRIAIILGDVSGKGMPAALYAVKLQGLFELLLDQPSSPKEVLCAINRLVAKRLYRQYFITALLAFIDFERSSMTLARAGHNPAVHYRAKMGKVDLLAPKGNGLGLQNSDQFDGHLIEQQVAIAAGDILVFYTDGITEAMNSEREEFGETRLSQLISDNASDSADELKERIITSLTSFVGKALFDDDVALVVLKI